MIRDIEPNDHDEMMAMMGEFYATSASIHQAGAAHFQQTLGTALGRGPHLRALVVHCGAEAAGYALLSFAYSNEAGGMVAIIDEIYIREAYRGRGLASQVLTFVETAYPQCRRFRLEVRADNAGALALYRKLGYETLDYLQMIKEGAGARPR